MRWPSALLRQWKSVRSFGWVSCPAALLARDFEAIIAAQGFAELPIRFAHARVAGAMNIAHRDPFDRLLIAQAQVEDMILVSNEALFDDFTVRRLW